MFQKLDLLASSGERVGDIDSVGVRLKDLTSHSARVTEGYLFVTDPTK
jgi:hypothetical protein